MKKVLFISHDASRTGAPIVFLNLLRWFKENTDIPFKIVLKTGGALEPEFAAIAPVMIANQPINRSLPQKVLNRLGIAPAHTPLQQFLADDQIGLIYSNTITNHQVLNTLSFLDCPIISHVHELEYVIHRMAGEQFSITKALTTRYIAVSEAVKQNLIVNHQIDANCIDTVYEFVPIDDVKLTHAVKQRDHIRDRLNIPPDAFVVGASGTLGWRKSPELLIQLAHTMRRKYPEAPVYFIWIGGDEQHEHQRHYELRYDIQKLGLDQTVRFLGVKPNPLDYFAAFDVFAMLSREDPYPLVCLEAALLEKPILCFADSGGEPEFVENDCGFVIPYLDIETTADKIYSLYRSPSLRESLGKQAAQKVRDRHDIKTSASQVAQIIQRFL